CREARSPRVPQDPGASATRLKRAALALRAERGAVACLVFARQRDGTRTRQVGRAIHHGVARDRDAERRGERGVRRDVREDLPPSRAILVDLAAGPVAQAALWVI